jgi:hypothetical protein
LGKRVRELVDMKKFDKINKYMESNKSAPIQKKIAIDFLPENKFLYHKDKKYDYPMITKFFSTNRITLNAFKNIGKCDKECSCGKNNWRIWQNDFMYYDILNKCFINVEDDEELEESPEIEEINFAVYVCTGCGAWSTHIFSESKDNLFPSV